MNKYQRLALFLNRVGQPDYRLRQISESIFSQKEINFAKMFFLPLELRRELAEEFGPWLSIKAIRKDFSSQAKKVLFSLPDNNRIEAVSMTYRNWQSACLSSQAGCPLGCVFCATGKMGLVRNLTTDEILDQLLFFYLKEEGVDTVSFMGMGEPLLNDNLFEVLEVITDKRFFNISPRRTNISTVGILPNLKRLIDVFPSVNIALSLNSSFPKQRRLLMPIEKKFPLKKIFPILNYHIRTNRRKVFLSYILLSGVNDSTQHASALISLIRSQGNEAYLYHVNLISFHPAAGLTFKPSSPRRTDFFKNQLLRAGIGVTKRRSLGLSLQGACGQLTT